MASSAEGLMDRLAQAFASRGLATPAADELAREIARRHPVAGRLGVDGTRRLLIRLGLEPEQAEDAALFLAAWEALSAGHSFAAVLERLGQESGSESGTRAAAYAAAHFLRTRSAAPPPSDGPRVRVLLALLIAGALAGWVLLAGPLLGGLG